MQLRPTVLCLVLGLAIVRLSQAQAQEGGKEFVPTNGMYTIVIPDGEKYSGVKRVIPLPSSDTSPNPKLKTKTQGPRGVPVEGSASTSKDGTIFLGASIGIPAVMMRDIPKERRFDVFRDVLVKEMKGKVSDEKDIKQDIVEGKEYQIERPEGFARLQLYTVSGWVIYALVEGKTKDDVTSKKANAFFDSLKMSDKAKEVFKFKEVKR
jgi:hypothetical protein